MPIEVRIGNLDTALYRSPYSVLERRVFEVRDEDPDTGIISEGAEKSVVIPGPEHFHELIDPMKPASRVAPPIAIRFSAETNGSRHGTTL